MWSVVVVAIAAAGSQCVGGDAPKRGSQFKWKNNPIYGIRKQIKILGVDSMLFRQKYVLLCVYVAVCVSVCASQIRKCCRCIVNDFDPLASRLPACKLACGEGNIEFVMTTPVYPYVCVCVAELKNLKI